MINEFGADMSEKAVRRRLRWHAFKDGFFTMIHVIGQIGLGIVFAHFIVKYW